MAASGKAILPRGLAYDIPAVVARFDLPEVTDIGEVRVFSSWERGRCFQSCDLECELSDGSDTVRIATHVRSGPWGQLFGGNAKSYFTRVFSSARKGSHGRWRTAAGAQDVNPRGSFAEQHAAILRAAERWGLPANPLHDEERQRVYRTALRRAAVRAGASAERIERVRPPIEEVLP